MVTAEIAVAVPALVLVLTLALGSVAAVMDQLRCVDAARTGARLLARGEPVHRVRVEVARQAPEDARIVLDVGTETVRVDVSSDLPGALAKLGVHARPHGIAYAVPEEGG